MGGLKIYDKNNCAACYFRTIANGLHKKCLIQLTEKCNLHCKHCFVSANNVGNEIEYDKIKNIIVPHMVFNNVTKVTLTGGEPFVYKKLVEVIHLLNNNNISTSICTNATLVTQNFLNKVSDCDLHFNVSLDGFSVSSHGRFRGNEDKKLYNRIIENIELLGEKRLLNGILVTPNAYSSVEEYVELCKFAKKCHAKYVLMNPLSQFGRGETTSNLALADEQMLRLRLETQKFDDENMEMVYIRFPNYSKKPLSGCVAGKIMYIFTNGDIAYCPYMVFAARDSVSLYDEKDFIIGNIFEDNFNWEQSMKKYKFPVEDDEVCAGCDNNKCQKGCYAARISRGDELCFCDASLCPKK